MKIMLAMDEYKLSVSVHISSLISQDCKVGKNTCR